MKFLLYTYYRINKSYYTFFEDMIYVEGKNTVRMSPGAAIFWLCEFLILLDTLLWAGFLVGLKDSNGFICIGGVIGVIAFNYFVFIYKGRLKKFYKEVHGYPKTKRRIWGVLIIVLIPTIIVLSIYSFIEFEKYRNIIHQ